MCRRWPDTGAGGRRHKLGRKEGDTATEKKTKKGA